MGNTPHVYVKEEEWEFFFNKVSSMECDFFARISLEIEVRKGMCEAESDCTHR